jgi:predicted ATPase
MGEHIREKQLQQEVGMQHPLLIENVHIKNSGCIQDLAMNLTPLHTLIGPNDSGKSTILRAVRTAMQLVNGNFTGSLGELPGQCQPFNVGFNKDADINILCKNYFNYLVQFKKNEDIVEKVELISGVINSFQRRIWDPAEKNKEYLEIPPNLTKEDCQNAHLPPDFSPKHPNWNMPSAKNRYKDLRKKLDQKLPFPKLINQQPRTVRIDPDSLREPGSLIPSSQPIDLQEKGMGLVSVLDALMNRNIDGFLKVREQVGRLFPTIASIGMKNIEVEKGIVSKILEFQLKNGTRILAQFMSEGVLYYLTFFALQYLEPASIILVEEPENGLHPSRIKDIMTILREISKTTQVLIATHSPLVINEMEPEEVSIVRRDAEKGTSVEPMKKTKNFEERAKTYALGELWLSYADGVDEKELRGDDSK